MQHTRTFTDDSVHQLDLPTAVHHLQFLQEEGRTFDQLDMEVHYTKTKSDRPLTLDCDLSAGNPNYQDLIETHCDVDEKTAYVTASLVGDSGQFADVRIKLNEDESVDVTSIKIDLRTTMKTEKTTPKAKYFQPYLEQHLANQ